MNVHTSAVTRTAYNVRVGQFPYVPTCCDASRVSPHGRIQLLMTCVGVRTAAHGSPGPRAPHASDTRWRSHSAGGAPRSQSVPFAATASTPQCAVNAQPILSLSSTPILSSASGLCCHPSVLCVTPQDPTLRGRASARLCLPPPPLPSLQPPFPACVGQHVPPRKLVRPRPSGPPRGLVGTREAWCPPTSARPRGLVRAHGDGEGARVDGD